MSFPVATFVPIDPPTSLYDAETAYLLTCSVFADSPRKRCISHPAGPKSP